MEETRQKAPGNGHFPAVLRFVAALLLSGTLCLAWGGGNLLAQIRSIYVTIDAADASIREILESIEAQSDLRFIYADEVKPILTKVVTVREKNVSANRILDQILPDVGLQYSVGGTQVRIYQAASGSRDVAQTVSGTVISGTDNSPLAGVMIYVEGTTAGTITNGDGSYTFTIPAKSKYVTFSVSTRRNSTSRTPSCSNSYRSPSRATRSTKSWSSATARRKRSRWSPRSPP